MGYSPKYVLLLIVTVIPKWAAAKLMSEMSIFSSCIKSKSGFHSGSFMFFPYAIATLLMSDMSTIPFLSVSVGWGFDLCLCY